jgi:hypothetical protein
MSVSRLLNAAGRRRSPGTLSGYLAVRPPRNKGLRYPADPPTVERSSPVMRAVGEGIADRCYRQRQGGKRHEFGWKCCWE